ncbi:GNAT family N-acetyltransferase [Paenibacillus durus]|uniref:Histone acetyltransferase n=1 Tax=Paenibacillus durus ATCC 35681 TaxID=1333534 RepID=A0A0F7FC30_PAEDU|nr:GNAT family N-acetyltransferase [Paenibacillus durus]AKG36343.1 histone acetyltransferase [Paenibacillus durus ATCC 35681]
MSKIVKLDLLDEGTLSDLWSLQHKAYRLEAEWIGFSAIPPLLETRDTLRNCGEDFYGCLSEDGELSGAVATAEERPGSLTITRMMVSPDHFRKGIAGRLLEHVFALYPNKERFIVSTGKKNVPAVSLYRKHGFVPITSSEVAPGVELIEFNRNGKR